MGEVEFTPARLREIADEWARLGFNETAAALRAAADKIEELRELYRNRDELWMQEMEKASQFRAALAARESLLRQAMDELRIAAGVIDGWEHEPSVVGGRARDLAAEIATLLEPAP